MFKTYQYQILFKRYSKGYTLITSLTDSIYAFEYMSQQAKEVLRKKFIW